jgi:hypothetical protein
MGTGESCSLVDDGYCVRNRRNYSRCKRRCFLPGRLGGHTPSIGQGARYGDTWPAEMTVNVRLLPIDDVCMCTFMYAEVCVLLRVYSSCGSGCFGIEKYIMTHRMNYGGVSGGGRQSRYYLLLTEERKVEGRD